MAHEGPLTQNHHSYKGSRYNVLIEWENGEVTSELLSSIATDDPVTRAIYAKDNGHLHLPGWKHFKSMVKTHQKFIRTVNEAKLQSIVDLQHTNLDIECQTTSKKQSNLTARMGTINGKKLLN